MTNNPENEYQIRLGKEDLERLDYTTYLRSCTACGGDRPWNILNAFRQGNSITVEAQCPGCDTIIPADILDDESRLSGGRKVDLMATGDKCWQCFQTATGQNSDGKDVCAKHGGPQEAVSEAPDASSEDSSDENREEGSSDEETSDNTTEETSEGGENGKDSEGTPT